MTMPLESWEALATGVCRELRCCWCMLQARFSLEQQREGLQRQAAAAEAKLQAACAARDNAQRGAHALSQHLALERERCAQLQGLLAQLRAAQFQVWPPCIYDYDFVSVVMSKCM